MRYLFGFLCVCALGMVPLIGCSDTQAECETGADCSDDNECTNDVCDSASKTCSNTPVANGTDCTFNRVAGVCVSGVCGQNLCQGVVCEDDGNECTGDVCNFADGTCNVSDGTPCSTGACLGGACTALATASGTVQLIKSFDEDPPAAGATVSVLGTSLSTTTDDLGRFSFDVPVGTVFLQSSKEDTWGGIDGYPVSQDGITNLELLVLADAHVAKMARDLHRDIDETKGIVLPYYDLASGLGGETVMLSELYDFAATLDAGGNWALSDKLLDGGESWLAFSGVNVTDELTVIPKGVAGVNDCYLEYPGEFYPVMAKFVTTFDVWCMPVP